MKTTTFFIGFILASLMSFAGTITAIRPTGQVIAGQNITIRFTTDFAPKRTIPTAGANTTLTSYFRVELSDANGNFGTNPTIITQDAIVPSLTSPNGTVTQVPILGRACNETNLSTAGTFSVSARIPSNIAHGSCYKIRVVCLQEYLVWSSPYTYGPNAIQNTPAYNSVASNCFSIAVMQRADSIPRRRG